MTQLSIRHISTNKYVHRLSAYTTPKMTGYIVSVTADGITSQYDFLDSMELALEYREALGEAWEAWSSIIDKSPYEVSEALWVRYIELAHHAPYPRWELEPMAEAADALYKAALVEVGRMQKVLSTKLRHENMDAPSNDDLMETADNWYELEQDLEAAELSDLDETYAAASNRYGY